MKVHKKWASFEYFLERYDLVGDRTVFFNLSRRPMILHPDLEDDMELLSDIITWGELYLHHWNHGKYVCSRCHNDLYSSTAKWKGPCVWPSFRKAMNNDDVSSSNGSNSDSNSNNNSNEISLSYERIENYNGYTCHVDEIYCNNCNLFIGHRFEDSIDKGDISDECTGWRH